MTHTSANRGEPDTVHHIEVMYIWLLFIDLTCDMHVPMNHKVFNGLQ